MTVALYPDQLLGKRPVWLLTLNACGRVWRLATDAVEVATEDGDTYSFAGHLDAPTVDEALGSLGDAPSEPTVSLDGVWLDGALKLLAEGHDLSAGRGELAVWVPGSKWEARRVLVSGRIHGPLTLPGDVVSLALGDTLGDDLGRLIPSAAVVDTESYPNAAANAVGQSYPVPIGMPGTYTTATGGAGTCSGSPAWMVDTTGAAEVVLISDGLVEAATVRIINTSDNTSDAFNVSASTDGRGRPVSVCSLATPGSLTVDSSHDYAVRWHTAGGMLGHRGEALAGLGDVAVWALRKSTLPIDLAAWAAVRPTLNRYTLAGYIDDPEAAPVEWVMDNLLPLVPLSLRLTAAGLAPVLWPHDARHVDAQVWLDVDALEGGLVLEEGSGIQSGGEYVSEVRIVYARRYHRGDYKRTRTLTGREWGPGEQSSPTIQRTAHLRAAHLARVARTGSDQPVVSEVVTDLVSDEETAGAVLAWRARMLSRPVQRVAYLASWDLGWLDVGTVARLSDKALALTDRVAVVESVTWTLQGPRYVFRLAYSATRDLFSPQK